MDLVTAPAVMIFVLLKKNSGSKEEACKGVLFQYFFTFSIVHDISRDLFNFEGNYLVLSAVTML